MDNEEEQRKDADKLLEVLGEDYDISRCVHCGSLIVITLAQLEYPECNVFECVRQAFKTEGKI